MSAGPGTERQLHLNSVVLASGRHNTSWRVSPDDAFSFLQVEYYQEIARIAERGMLDAVFFADSLTLNSDHSFRPWNCMEPTILLAAVAPATTHIGLMATVSTTFNDPYNVARRLMTMDHVSHGRVGWNIVTTSNAAAAENFSMGTLPDHDGLYERAAEFVEVVLKLWGSWEDGALIGDRETGVFVDRGRVREIGHVGREFRVRGPLDIPRSPQGWPVLVQAGASTTGKEFGARFADALFTVQRTLEDAQAFYREMKARAGAHGREPEDLLILPGLYLVVGGTEEEARRRKAEMDALLDFEDEKEKLVNHWFRVSPEGFDLDKELPYDLIECLPNASSGFSQAIVSEARRGHLTIRDLIGRNAQGGHRFLIGAPEQIADDIEKWFVERGADGFNLNNDGLPSGLEAFVDHVVPILQKRGLFRTEYVGGTLRENLGLRMSGRD